MRKLAQRFGRALHCHKNMVNAQVTPDLSLPQAVHCLCIDERRALMQWLTRNGPFWEDMRIHGRDEYLECKGEVVTDTAVGEAAYRCLTGFDHQLVSLTPSSWEFSPIPVRWIREGYELVEVANYWEQSALELALQSAPAPLTSWEQLADVAVQRCPDLKFLPSSFEPLQGHPFVEGAAQRLLILLETLQRFRSCHDEGHERTAEGQRIYQDHFTGKKAWFTDSSDTEKLEYRAKLTFRGPTAGSLPLFCPWHGKVKSPQLRIHFSWPIPAGATLYIAYVGPKITR
jgi:hypothetical protein